MEAGDLIDDSILKERDAEVTLGGDAALCKFGGVNMPAVAVEGGAGLNACVFFTLRLLPVDAFIFSSLTSSSIF